jgi:hypothetical protein
MILAWVLSGIMTLLGALAYGELAAMYPRAGGQYLFLRESMGPLMGFLYGWTFFVVIGTGTIAAVAVAFGRFLGVLIPAIGPERFAWFPQADVCVAALGCTNPASPGATGWERLDSYFDTRAGYPVAGGPIRWSTEGAPPVRYVRTEGLVSAKCVNDGRIGYLSVRTNADPRDKRTDRIGGEVGALGFFLPGWGMHLVDVAIAQGDMIRQVEELGR